MTSRTRKRLVALTVLATLVLAVVGAIGARSVLRERSLARDLEAGMAAYARADYPEGLQHLSRYVGRIKTNSAAILALADCRRQVPAENGRHLITALAYARVAAQAAPGDPKPLELMLKVCGQLGFNTEAIEVATKLLEIDPKHLEALMARTRALASMGRIDGSSGALESARETAAKHPDSVAAHDAVVQLMRALGRDTKSIRDYSDKVMTERNRGEPSIDFALFDCRVAILTRDPTSREDDLKIEAAVRRAAGLTVRNRQQLSDLLRYVDLFQVSVEGATPPRLLSDDLLARAEAEPKIAHEVALLRAERAWKSGLTLPGSEGSAALDRPLSAMSDRELGVREVIRNPAKGDGSADTEVARAELTRRGTDEAAYWLRILAGRDALAADDLHQAVIELSEAAKQNSAHGFAQFFLGDALSRTGDWQAAAEQFAAAARTDPVWRTARAASARLLADNGRFEEARQQAAAGLAIQKLQPDAILYADISVRMLESRRASDETVSAIVRDLDEFHRLNPGIAVLEGLRARALLAAGRTDEARQAAQELLALAEPPPQESLIKLAVGFRTRDPLLADRLEALAAKDAGQPATTLALRARSLATAGHLNEAKELLQQGVAQASGAEKLRLTLLLAWVLEVGQDPAAKDILKGLADANPRDVPVQLALLRSSFAWADESIVQAALARVGAVLGQDSTLWRLFEAQRLLTFSPSPENAARVISSDRDGLNLTQVVRTDAANIDAALILAHAYLLSKDKDGMGDTESAIRTLARAVDADPWNPAAYPRLIELLQKTGRPAEATQRLTTFLRIDRLPLSIQRQRARLLKSQGMLAQYSAELKTLALQGQAEDRLAYARERAAAGDMAQAGPLFDSLLADERPSADAVVAIAQFVAFRDGFEAGFAVLARLPPETSADERKRLEAMLSFQGRQFDQAERLLKERTGENSAKAWADLAEFYLKQKRGDDAEHAVQRGLAAAPQDARLLWLSGTIRMGFGNEETSGLSDLVKAAATTDFEPDAREIVEAFRAYGPGLGDPRLVTALEAVTRRYPTSMPAWQLLVGIHRQANQKDLAAKAALAATQLLPASPRAARLATETLGEAGRFAEAEAMASRWRALAPAAGLEVDLALARLKGMRGQVADAVGILDPHKEKIAAAAEERPEDLQVYAAALAAAGRVEDARRLLGDRVQTVSAWAVRYLRITDVLTSRPEEARAWLLALNIGDDAPAEIIVTAAQAWFTLGSVTTGTAAGKKEDFDLAARYAQRLAAMPGLEGVGFSLLGAIYMTRGETDPAIEAYRAAMARLPEDAGVLNNLAYLLASRPNGSSEAVVLAGRAVELATKQRLADSTRSRFLETLGVAELRQGNFAAAQTAFKAGLAIDPGAMDLNIGLAEALIGLNQYRDAEEVADRIAALPSSRPGLPPDLSSRLDSVRERLAAKR